jgi:hypothetical protein
MDFINCFKLCAGLIVCPEGIVKPNVAAKNEFMAVPGEWSSDLAAIIDFLCPVIVVLNTLHLVHGHLTAGNVIKPAIS